MKKCQIAEDLCLLILLLYRVICNVETAAISSRRRVSIQNVEEPLCPVLREVITRINGHGRSRD